MEESKHPLSSKLLNRFYEALVLLDAVREANEYKTMGDRISGEGGYGQFDHIEELLYNLCIVCDYKKGGETVTAMALQQKPEKLVYWICSQTTALTHIIPFLRQTMDKMKKASDLKWSKATEQALEKDLRESFTNFCYKRLLKTHSLLSNYIEKTIEGQERWQLSIEDKIDYRVWLESLQQKPNKDNLLTLCEAAYIASSSKYVQSDFLDSVAPLNDMVDNLNHPGRLVRHFLGRLSSTVRAANKLSKLASSRANLFQDFEIRICDTGQPVNAPQLRRSADLPAIARRMLPLDSPELPNLTEALETIDFKFGLMKTIRAQFQDSNIKPQVHAETALLEHLWYAGIDFYKDHRYIACSKAACFCCYHYICNHPGQVLKPQCHRKIWLKWSPPSLPIYTTIGIKEQRDTMNQVIQEVRKAAIKLVKGKCGDKRWRPDSTSGITKSLSRKTFASGSSIYSVDSHDDSDRNMTVYNDESESEDGGVPLPAAILTRTTLLANKIQR